MQNKCDLKKDVKKLNFFFAYVSTHLIFTEELKVTRCKEEKVYLLTDCSKNSE